jgi:hypothetical protein
MSDLIFDEKDIKQIEARGLTLQKVISQIETLKKGIPFIKLERPCTIGDGITVIEEQDLHSLEEVYLKAALSGRVMKFIPASGASSRMFKLLLSFNNRYETIDIKYISAKAQEGDPDYIVFHQFIRGIRKLPFYNDLKSVMAKKGLEIDVLISNGQYKEIVETILTSKGLEYADAPKGLIKFHQYTDGSRTPFEEHLIVAGLYKQDKNRVSRVHFTVSPAHLESIKDHLAKFLSKHNNLGLRYEVTFSTQKPSTDTITVDLNNKPFRDKKGRLVFWPGGHGALLENLNDVRGDIVFIKNIDNVVPDKLKQEIKIYTKALGGYLVNLQDRIFGYLERISRRDVDERLIKEMFEFARTTLSIIPPIDVERGSIDERVNFLFSRFNRPIRVCGMVKNEGEYGGAPFWVKDEDNTLSLQIVESSQVDMESDAERAIWESATHFNPVDLVCGVRDYSGRPFNLLDFRDPDTGFISVKSHDGRELKALEMPGLWNGGMARWNTVFVDVPRIVFNPVKTVIDLLREEHQAS